MEEKLREAACFGDLDGLQSLLKQGADINGQHLINGWTALHWAAKRNNAQCVQILLSNGANYKLKNSKGEMPFQLTTNDALRNLLGGTNEFNTTLERKKHKSGSDSGRSSSALIPNYLRNPILSHKVDVETPSPPGDRDPGSHNNGSSDLSVGSRKEHQQMQQMHARQQQEQKQAAAAAEAARKKAAAAVKILKVRLTGDPEFDDDFIEIDLHEQTLTFRRLIEAICEEFSIDPKTIVKLRKLPNTKLRRDIEVQRMEDYQEVEAEIAEVGM